MTKGKNPPQKHKNTMPSTCAACSIKLSSLSPFDRPFLIALGCALYIIMKFIVKWIEWYRISNSGPRD